MTFPNDRTSHALSHEGRSKVPDKSYPGTTEEAFMPFADDSVGSCCSGRVVKSMIKEAWTASRMERPVLLTTHEVQGTGGFNCKVQSSICNIVMITKTERDRTLAADDNDDVPLALVALAHKGGSAKNWAAGSLV